MAEAERTLATKAAAESKRIATDKVSKAMTRLSDLQRKDLKPRDSRIFPGAYPLLMNLQYRMSGLAHQLRYPHEGPSHCLSLID